MNEHYQFKHGETDVPPAVVFLLVGVHLKCVWWRIILNIWWKIMLSLYILLQNRHGKTSPKNLVLVIQKWRLQIHLQRLLDPCTTDHILNLYADLISLYPSFRSLSHYRLTCLFCFIVFRPEKRKHKAMGSITEKNGSVEQRKRKRENKINALIPSSNERVTCHLVLLVV